MRFKHISNPKDTVQSPTPFFSESALNLALKTNLNLIFFESKKLEKYDQTHDQIHSPPGSFFHRMQGRFAACSRLDSLPTNNEFILILELRLTSIPLCCHAFFPLKFAISYEKVEEEKTFFVKYSNYKEWLKLQNFFSSIHTS